MVFDMFWGWPKRRGVLERGDRAGNVLLLFAVFILALSHPSRLWYEAMSANDLPTRLSQRVTDHLIDALEVAAPALLSPLAALGVPALLEHLSHSTHDRDEALWRDDPDSESNKAWV